MHRRHRVTAVLVVHDGARWLPEVLAGLRAQTRCPERLVAVDTGSTDGSAALLTRGAVRVVPAPRQTGYGAAVALGLAATGVGAAGAIATTPGGQQTSPAALPVDWVWLLHDDCAPEREALERLLDVADRSPSAAVIGPKVLDWQQPRLLVEVGLTTDAAGRRETSLDRHEIDQGQYDGVRDVLAVGTAGALVRRDVWDALGGLDPALPLLRDDIDFGWRVNLAGHRVLVAPDARVRHVRAVTTRRREPSAARGSPAGIDRRHGLFTVLANVSAAALPLAVVRIAFAGLLRTLLLLLTRAPRAAGDELRALAFSVGHPARLLAARRRRAGHRTTSPGEVRHLLAGRTARLRRYLEMLAELGVGGAAVPASAPGARFGETGPSVADEEERNAGQGVRHRLLLRPPVVLAAVLLVVALIAESSLLGGGRLFGGRLLPAPTGASDLWAAFIASWHPVGPGSPAPAPPQLALLALLATVLAGKAWLAVDVLALGCVPLAGLSAYVALRRLTGSGWLRAWGAAAYALLPVTTGVVAAGRLGTAVLVIAAPLLLAGGARLLATDPAVAGWRPAWAGALGLAVTSAFEPQTYLIAVPLLLGGGLVGRWRSRRTGRAAANRRGVAALIMLIVPPVLLLPWTGYLVGHPAIFLLGTGRATATSALTDPDRNPLALLALSPGGPGLPPAWLTAGLVAAALAALLGSGRRGEAVGAWWVAGVGLLAAVIASRLSATPVSGAEPVPGWAGPGIVVVGAGIIAAAVLGADRVRGTLARRSFGLAHPAALVVALAAALLPLAAGVAWIGRGAADPIQRRAPVPLPAYAQVLLGPQDRVLFIRVDADRTVSYALDDRDGSHLGDADLPPSVAARSSLDATVERLVAPRGGSAAGMLATYGVKYVALTLRGDPGALGGLSTRLDGEGGLTRSSYQGNVAIWQIDAPLPHLAVLAPGVSAAAPPASAATVRASALPSGPTSADVTVPAGPIGRTLVLAEAADPGWQASVDGHPLPRRTAWGWAQGFGLPAGGGHLVLTYADGGRPIRLGAEGALVALVCVLAAPGRRRPEEPPGEQPASAPATLDRVSVEGGSC